MTNENRLEPMSEELIRRITEPGMQQRIMSAVDANGYSFIVALAKQMGSNGVISLSNETLMETLHLSTKSALHSIRTKCHKKKAIIYDKGNKSSEVVYTLTLDQLSID